MKKILHIVQYDEKFTNSYLNYFIKVFPEYQHFYVLIPKNTKYDKKDDCLTRKDVFYLKSIKDCFTKTIEMEIHNSSKIILSGVFSIKFIGLLLTKKNLKKTYLHFWGGDYASITNATTWKMKLRKVFLTKLIRNCRAIINLMDNEYEIIEELFKINKKHFIARFPPRLENVIDYDLIMKSIYSKKNRIVIGNSATESNNHLKVFEILQKLKNENLEIFCPLSYGDLNYRKTVIEKGKEIFGEKFHPITEMMNIVDYSSFLQTCSIGIFYIERQQALGNIGALVRLKKKIFLLKDTPLWFHYQRLGIEVYSINDIANSSIEDFFFFDEEIAKQNALKMDISRKIEDAQKEWFLVLSD